MILYKKSKGIAHLIPLVLIFLLLLGLTGYLVYSSQQEKEISLYNSLIGDSGDIAGYEAPVPTSQITSIPKGECDIFVSPNGTGNGSSEASPMKMINEAVQRAQPGQAVCLKGGEYRQVVSIQKSGTASAPIKIGGYSGGGLPIVSGGVNKGDQYKLPNAQCQNLDGECTRPNLGQQCKRPGCVNDPLFLIKGASNLKIIGIDVRGSSGRGFQMGSNSVNVSVDGMRTYHNWSSGFQISSQEPKWSSKNLDFNRIAIYDNIRGMAEKNVVGGGGGQLHAVDGAVFRNSAVFRNFGEGLNVGKAAKNVIVRDSIFWENAHTALYANGAITSAFDRNFLFCTGDKFAWLRAAPNAAYGHEDTVGAAITIRNERGVTSSHGVGFGTIASNNTVVGCSTTITVGAQPNTTLSDVIVANNTLISPRRPGKPNGPGITFGGTLSNILVVNNVVAGGYMDSHTGVNLVNNIATHGTARSGVRIVDPKASKLVGLTEKLNPANMDPADYVITSGSPAIGAGTKPNARGLVDNDIFGNSRGNNPIDLGSYEFGGAKNWPDVYGALLAGATIPDDDDDYTPPADSDGDGVPNNEDQCDNIPAGPTPDPERPGCPLEDDDYEPQDSDNDGVEDSEDECPDTPKGNNPDPERTGCPMEEDDDDTSPIANLVLNGAFNSGPSTSNEVAKNWKFSRGTLGKVNAKLARPNPRGLSRGNVMRINVNKYPVSGVVNIFQPGLDLDPNARYEVTFVAKSSKAGQLSVLFTDMGFVKEKLADRVEFNTNNSWKRYSKQFTTKAFSADKAARLSLTIRIPSDSVIYIDTISVKKID
jgi:hypothetical protein